MITAHSKSSHFSHQQGTADSRQTKGRSLLLSPLPIWMNGRKSLVGISSLPEALADVVQWKQGAAQSSHFSAPSLQLA